MCLEVAVLTASARSKSQGHGLFDQPIEKRPTRTKRLIMLEETCLFLIEQLV